MTTNPYAINTKAREIWEVGYERCMSGAPRHECLETDPNLVQAFQEGWDYSAAELRGEIEDEKIAWLSDHRKPGVY